MLRAYIFQTKKTDRTVKYNRNIFNIFLCPTSSGNGQQECMLKFKAVKTRKEITR